MPPGVPRWDNRFAVRGLSACHVNQSIEKGYPMSESAEATREKLIQDFKVVIADAEELLKATASQAGEKVSAARAKIEDHLHTAKIKLAEAEEAVIHRTKQAARATDEYVHENPWRAVGMAAGIGLLVGLLIGRR